MKWPIVLMLCGCLFLSGCGNYQELNEYEIVAGMALDQGEQGYRVTLELMQLEGSMQDGMQSQIAVLEGTTIPQALDTAKARFSKQLHFGNMQIIVISRELAQNEGVAGMLDWFIREGNVRETIQLIISNDESAGKVLEATGIDMPVASYALERIVNPPHEPYSHTREISIYNAIDTLQTPGKTLVLPAVQTWRDKEDAQHIELSGLAVFSNNHLRYFLQEAHTPFYLYAMNQLREHELDFNLPGEQGKGVITINNSTTIRTFHEEGDKLVFRFEIAANGQVIQTAPDSDLADANVKRQMEEAASAQLQAEVAEMIETARTEGNLDITDMGYSIYLCDQKLWERLEPNWAKMQNEIAVEVSAKVKIDSSGTVRET